MIWHCHYGSGYQLASHDQNVFGTERGKGHAA
jgi:hypothetical protein